MIVIWAGCIIPPFLTQYSSFGKSSSLIIIVIIVMGEKLYSAGLGKQVGKKLWEESKKTWHIALPAILTAVTQFSIDFVTAAYVGHLGDVELAAVSEVQNVVEGFVYGVMVINQLTVVIFQSFSVL